MIVDAVERHSGIALDLPEAGRAPLSKDGGMFLIDDVVEVMVGPELLVVFEETPSFREVFDVFKELEVLDTVVLVSVLLLVLVSI